MTIPDPSDTLGDPIVGRTMRQLVNRNAQGSGLTAPYGTIEDNGRVELSSEVMKKTGTVAATLKKS